MGGRQGKDQTGEYDEEGSLHDVPAHFHLAQGDHDDEGHDEVARNLAEDVGVRDLRIVAISRDRLADEPREVGTEDHDQHRHQNLR